eukprot:scaffold16168_cov110-Isochrysis_galbana.AAC.4
MGARLRQSAAAGGKRRPCLRLVLLADRALAIATDALVPVVASQPTMSSGMGKQLGGWQCRWCAELWICDGRRRAASRERDPNPLSYNSGTSLVPPEGPSTAVPPTAHASLSLPFPFPLRPHPASPCSFYSALHYAGAGGSARHGCVRAHYALHNIQGLIVGECLVGRHVPGVAVDRCASFGVVRAGSVLLPGLGVVDRWVGHDCFTCVCCCLRPHTITPLPWRERGIQFPQHKNKHTSQARGDEARKAQGGGERNLHLVFRGRWTIARGSSYVRMTSIYFPSTFIERTMDDIFIICDSL